jgi:hypothetical protein
MAEISPLRRRMIDDMMIRNLSPATRIRGRLPPEPAIWPCQDNLMARERGASRLTG